MFDQKLAIITIHDVDPSHSKEIQRVTEQLNKLKIRYNLSIVPYYSKKYNLKDYSAFCDEISCLLKYRAYITWTLSLARWWKDRGF
jgi:predicted deacetylase